MTPFEITYLITQALILLVAIVAVRVAYSEIRLIRSDIRISRNTAWAEFLLRLDQRFLESPLRDVASKIEAGTLEINPENKWDVITYLGTFELFLEFKEKDILDWDVIAQYYADSIIAASEHKGIQREILKDEKSSIDWKRFNELVGVMREAKAKQ